MVQFDEMIRGNRRVLVQEHHHRAISQHVIRAFANLLSGIGAGYSETMSNAMLELMKIGHGKDDKAYMLGSLMDPTGYSHRTRRWRAKTAHSIPSRGDAPIQSPLSPVCVPVVTCAPADEDGRPRHPGRNASN